MGGMFKALAVIMLAPFVFSLGVVLCIYLWASTLTASVQHMVASHAPPPPVRMTCCTPSGFGIGTDGALYVQRNGVWVRS